MADSTIAVTVTDVDSTQSSVVIRGTLAVTASPGTYTAGGYVLDFSNIDAIKSNSVPKRVLVFSARLAGATAANLFDYSFSPGTTIANGRLQLFTGAAAQTALTELSNGNTPAGVSGDTIEFEAIFPKLV